MLLSYLIQLVIGFLGIGLIVLVHETGHFIAARLSGVRVETFGIGMGPRLFSIYTKNTEIRFSLIPFGGYCRMDGSIDLVQALRDESRSFTKGEYGSYFTTTPLVRFFIFLAGPLTSFLFSFLLFLAVSFIPVMQAVDPPRVAVVSDYPELFKSSITQEEILTGDLILSVDGQTVSTWQEAEELIASAGKADLDLKILRDGQILDVTAEGLPSGDTFLFGLALYQEPVIGRVEDTKLFQTGDRIISVNGHRIDNTYDFYMLSSSDMNIVLERDGQETEVFYPASNAFPFAWQSRLIPMPRQGFLSSAASAFSSAVSALQDTLSSLSGLVHQNSEEVRNEITGPTRAAQSIGSITTLGLESGLLTAVRAFLYLLSLVSVSLCVANLLPVPVFDGGGMLINLIQMITGKEMTPKSYVVFQIIGLVCSVVIIAALYSLDIIHYLRG